MGGSSSPGEGGVSHGELVLVEFLFPWIRRYKAHAENPPHPKVDGHLNGWTVGWSAGWLNGWLAGWLAGRLVGWMVGWLVGWFF